MKILAPKPAADLKAGDTIQVVFDQETHLYTIGAAETLTQFKARVKAGIQGYQASLGAPAAASTAPVDITDAI